MTKKKIKKNAGTSWENSEQKIKHCNIIIIILCLWNENGDGDGGVAGWSRKEYLCVFISYVFVSFNYILQIHIIELNNRKNIYLLHGIVLVKECIQDYCYADKFSFFF